jgi:hypothetical protein
VVFGGYCSPVQVKLTEINEKELTRIVRESRNLFCVSGLVNLILDHWRSVRDNEQKLKASYACPQKPVSPK